MLLSSHAPLGLRWVVDMPKSRKCMNFWRERLRTAQVHATSRNCILILTGDYRYSCAFTLHDNLTWFFRNDREKYWTEFKLLLIHEKEVWMEEQGFLTMPCSSMQEKTGEQEPESRYWQILAVASEHPEGHSLLKDAVMWKGWWFLRKTAHKEEHSHRKEGKKRSF